MDLFFENRSECLVNNPPHAIPWGDTPTSDKTTTRILFQNINGIRRANNYSKAHIICMGLDLLKVDIAGFAETNLDWNIYENKQACSEIFRRYWKQTKIGMTSSIHNTNKYYQPGGVCMIVGFPWASHTKTFVDETGLGRWTESIITGRNNRRVSIICAYIVCKDRIETSGPNTAFTQQWKILKEQNPSSNPNPRLSIMECLLKKVKDLQSKGIEVILMMDANDTLQNPNSELTKWTRESGLVDPFIQRHGTTDEPATYARGSKRIDYILTSEQISEYITAAGILPIHDICFSDHRALFLDIDLKAYLRSQDPPNLIRYTRGISSDDPRSVKKYQELLQKELISNDLEESIREIDHYITANGVTQEAHDMMDKLDQRFTNIRLDCEKQSKSKFRHPWSPALRIASYNHHYWNIWLSQKKLNRNFYKSRIRFITEETEEYELDPDFSIRFVKFKLSQAQKKLNEVQSKADELRQSFLEERASMYASEGNTTLEKVIKSIIFHERRARIFQKLKRLRGKEMSAGLDFVIDINENGEEYRIQDPDEIFETIIRHNIKHFSQADATEFANEPMKSLLGPTATNEICEAILSGQFNTEEIDCSDAARALLLNLKRDLDTEISDEITAQDLMKGYRKWGEFTSTSPSGLHLSHERAVLRYMKDQQEIADSTDSPTLCERVFGIKAKLIQWAIHHGHVFQRWTKVVNAMIEKIKGKPLINKLRVIHLIESDFNLMIGILWGRRLVSLGESNNIFNDGQGGSRPDRRTQELLIQKHLVYSIWRMGKLNGISFDNDAKSCFDRIVMPVASLASQHAGMTKRACETFLNTLNQMKYHVKTSAGISSQSYSSTEKYTIHGPGQGGRGSPCVWLVVSSIIMKTLTSTQAKGSQLCNPNKSISTTQFITGFVDDVTHWYSTMIENEPIKHMCENMTNTAQLWEQLLSVTGGKLELQKCFSYLISWTFNEEGVPTMSYPDKAPLDITLVDSESNQVFKILQRSSHESHRTLGVMETPNGDYSDEFKRLMDKSKSFAQVLATAKLTRYEAHTLYFTTYVPSMIYSAAIGTLSIEQSEKIQGSVTQQFLAKMGFNRCTPSSITFGPPKLGGIGLRHLFYDQNTEKAIFIIRLLRCDRPASKVLRIQLDWAQHLSGLSDPILENTVPQLPHIGVEHWIINLRKFLYMSDATIRMIHKSKAPTKCSNDTYLMDKACSLNLSSSTLTMINRCRMFLHAETLSDICSYSGKSIDLLAFNCHEDAQLISCKLWPQQPRPGPNHRKVWKAFLSHFCKVDSLQLEHPLGDWTCQEIPRKSGCTTFYAPHLNKIIVQSDIGWRIADISSRRTYKAFFDPKPYLLGNNIELIPTDHNVVSGRNIVDWRNQTFNLPNTSCQNNLETWESYINSISDWEKSLILGSRAILPIDSILSILEDESTEVFIVSDGGCMNNLGSYGWVVSNQLLNMAEGRGIVPGEPMSSYRAEAFGKLSWITYLHHISLFHRIQIKCKIRSFCDNKSIVLTTRTTMKYESMYSVMSSDFDVLRTIAIKQQQLTSSTHQYEETQHVKAHQDRIKKAYELSIEEILNIKADQLASESLDQAIKNEQEIPNFVLPFGMAFLCFGNKLQSSNEATSLRWRLSEFNLQTYYCKRFRINQTTLQDINWAALRLARDKLPPGLKTFSIKYSIGWLATGSRMKMQGRELSDCPNCGESEDSDHLFLCQAKQDKVQQTIHDFKNFLDSIHTDQDTGQALLEGIRRWTCTDTSQSTNQDNSKKYKPSLSQAIHHQKEIGWNLFVRGFMSQKWAAYHEEVIADSEILGNVWSSKICLWWIQKSHEYWIERNNKLHDPSSSCESWKNREIREQVTKLYGYAPLLDADDRIILHTPLEEKLSETTASLQSWITTMEPIIKICMKKQEDRIRSQHRDIRTFFRSNKFDGRENSRNKETEQLNFENNQQKEHNEIMPIDQSDQISITNNSNTDHPRYQTEDDFRNFMLERSGEVYPPVRVEAPRVGDPDRAASLQE